MKENNKKRKKKKTKMPSKRNQTTIKWNRTNCCHSIEKSLVVCCGIKKDKMPDTNLEAKFTGFASCIACSLPDANSNAKKIKSSIMASKLIKLTERCSDAVLVLLQYTCGDRKSQLWLEREVHCNGKSEAKALNQWKCMKIIELFLMTAWKCWNFIESKQKKCRNDQR